jgi:hypothetical protein
MIINFISRHLQSSELSAYIATPDVGREHLILLVEVKDLYEVESVLDLDLLGRVLHRTTNQANSFVIAQQILDQFLFVRHRQTEDYTNKRC